MVNTNTGYMFILLEKDEYMPGEIIKGSVFFEFFHLSFQTHLKLKFEGVEIVPAKLVKQIQEDQNNLSNADNMDNESMQKHNDSHNNSGILSDFTIKSNSKLPEIKIARRPSNKPTEKLPPIKDIKKEKSKQAKNAKSTANVSTFN